MSEAALAESAEPLESSPAALTGEEINDELSSPSDFVSRMRHTTAHVMAQAVRELFPDAKMGIGPVIENGFYYDFDLPRALTPDDLPIIEERMARIVKENLPLTKFVEARDVAKERCAAMNQPYKVELIDNLPVGEEISFYQQGDFVDLCRGPHIESTGRIGAFKLTSIAGAYWRGSEKNPQMQRIYGIAFQKKGQLTEHLEKLEEAKKRDHRVLGRQLGLFAFSEDVGPGIPLFLPKGEIIRHTMETYVRDLQTKYGYDHVWTGHIGRESLYRKSGHLDNYGDDKPGGMFPPIIEPDGGRFRLKPMNCPSHMTLFNTQRHSYRDLPVRYAEFATLYRYEKSGELSGLTRVRSLTQDDCHIFCTEAQIEEEFALALRLIKETLATYGFTDYYVRLSLPDDKPDSKFVADAEKWAKATSALENALTANGVHYIPEKGEAAFYGPKADFIARDVLGREWQFSTIQVDFILPARLGCIYVGEDSQTHTPVVLHRAVTGSTERFMGLLIEQYAGAFPAWLAPEQVRLLPIADRHNDYCQLLKRRMVDLGFRVHLDDRSEKTGKKIAEAQVAKVPYMLVIGDRDIEAGTVSVRERERGDLGARPVDDFLVALAAEVSSRRAPNQ